MRVVRYLGLLLVAWGFAVLQGRMTGGVHLIDPFLLLTLLYGLRGEPPAGTLAGFGAGIVQDSLSGGLVGLNGFTKTLIGYLSHGFGGRLLVTSPVPQAGILVLCTLGNQAVLGLLSLVLRGTFPLPTLWVLAASCLANTIAGLLLFALAESRTRRLGVTGY